MGLELSNVFKRRFEHDYAEYNDEDLLAGFSRSTRARRRSRSSLESNSSGKPWVFAPKFTNLHVVLSVELPPSR